MAGILITGAAGTHGGVGSHLIPQLVAQGAEVRAMVRTMDARAEALKQAGADVVLGDFFSLKSLRSALEGMDRVFFCYPLAAGLLQATANLCVAARDAGVKAVANVSLMFAAPDHPSPVARDHWLSEEIFDWADVGAIHLRGGFFYENILRFAAEGIAQEDKLYFPLGEGDVRMAWISAADLAAASAGVLLRPDAEIGKRLDITDETVMSISEVAENIGRCLGRDVRYVAAPLPDFMSRNDHLLGDNAQLRRHMGVLSEAMGAGRVIGKSTDHVRRLTGEAPTGIEGFVHQYASDFSPH